MKAVARAIWSFIKRTDKLLLILCLLATALGALMLYSLTQGGLLKSGMTVLKRQLEFAALGVTCAVILSALDYRFLAKLWFLYVPPTLLMTLLTLTPLGVERAGQRAWLKIATGIQLQPSEFLKIAFILSFAFHLVKAGEHLNRFVNLLLLCLHGGLFIGAVMLQKDDGTALVYVAIFVAMLFAAGISWKYIAAVGLASPGILAILWFKVLEPYQKNRILSVINPELDTQGVSHQQLQSRIAIGSGQFQGKGLFGGSYVYVYEIENDFIFAHIGQTLGFLGCLITLLLLTGICVKLIASAWRSEDLLGRLICSGAFAMIFFHTAINVGMVVGILPVIGIPLPFISQGGTSVLSMYLAVGLCMSVHAHRPKPYTMFYRS